MKSRNLIATFILLLFFNSILAQSCSWTFDYENIHISEISSTNDQNVLLVSINDYRKNTRTIALNKTDSRFLEPNNFTKQHFDLLEGFKSYYYNYNVSFTNNSDNESMLVVSTNSESKLFEKTLNQTYSDVILYFISQKLNQIYVIAKITEYSEKYILLATKVDNSSIIHYSEFTFRGYVFNKDENIWSANENENLFFSPPGCCYCGVGDYFTFNETSMYQIYSADSIAKYNLFDPRSKEFIVATFIGNLSIYNYEKNTVTNLHVNLHDIDTYLSSNGIITTNFELVLYLLMVTTIIGIMRKRKK